MHGGRAARGAGEHGHRGGLSAPDRSARGAGHEAGGPAAPDLAENGSERILAERGSYRVAAVGVFGFFGFGGRFGVLSPMGSSLRGSVRGARPACQPTAAILPAIGPNLARRERVSPAVCAPGQPALAAVIAAASSPGAATA